MLEQILIFLGRLHPLFVHLPIGILVVLGVVETAGIFSARLRLSDGPRRIILGLTALSSIASVGAGLLLARDGGYDDALLERHRNLGYGVGALACVLYLITVRNWRWLYWPLLYVTLGMLVVAGHNGGSLTHGTNYLVLNLKRPEAAPKDKAADNSQTSAGIKSADARGEGKADTPAASPRIFSALVQPVFEQRCVGCHGETKVKADLRADTYAALLAGGESGAAFEPGNAAESLLTQQFHLPLDDDAHMPPEGKPQLTAEQIALVEWWINAGGTEEVTVADAPPPPALADYVASKLGLVPEEPLDRVAVLAQSESIAAKLGILIRPLAATDPWLSVNARPEGSDFGDDQLAALEPIARAIRQLDLGNTKVSDDGLVALAPMKNLKRLHLDGTKVTDTGLRELLPLKQLEWLNLHGTKVTDDGLSALALLPSLRRLFLWGTKVSPGAAEDLAGTLNARGPVNALQKEITALEARIAAERFEFNLGEDLPETTRPPMPPDEEPFSTRPPNSAAVDSAPRP